MRAVVITRHGGPEALAVRALPDQALARDVFAVARASSVNRPSVAAILAAVHTAAAALRPPV